MTELEAELRKIKELNWSTVHGARVRDVRDQIDRMVHDLINRMAANG